MSAAADAYASSSGWSWPKEADTVQPREEEAPLPGAFTNDGPDEPEEVPEENSDSRSSAPKPQRHYSPRTCRICLEVVHPTFEPAVNGVSTFLNPTPSVSYISSDPESGRLIRPCKCKGSQKYVHEGCLQAWRHADPAYGRRNYWECPTCKFRYRLERMRWSRWISSTATQVVLTVAILLTTVFIFGFIADPILNLYIDPYETITSPLASTLPLQSEDEDTSWAEHFLKGLASLGLLGFVKTFFAMWWNLRNTGILGGGGGRRRGRGGTGRDRLENINWSLVIIGVITFLYTVWKWVRGWTRRTLEKAGEHVLDVQGDDDDEEDEFIEAFDVNPTASGTSEAGEHEVKKSQ